MGIPGEDLEGVMPAREFVNWYNSHPDFANVVPPLDTEDVVVVGQGNVALDCARILLTPPSVLEGTDIAVAATDALKTRYGTAALLLGTPH